MFDGQLKSSSCLGEWEGRGEGGGGSFQASQEQIYGIIKQM